MLKKHYKKNKGLLSPAILYPIATVIIITVLILPIVVQNIQKIEEKASENTHLSELEKITQTITEICQDNPYEYTKNRIESQLKTPQFPKEARSPNGTVIKKIKGTYPVPTTTYGIYHLRKTKIVYRTIRTYPGYMPRKLQIATHVSGFNVSQKDEDLQVDLEFQVRKHHYKNQIIVPKY